MSPLPILFLSYRRHRICQVEADPSFFSSHFLFPGLDNFLSHTQCISFCCNRTSNLVSCSLEAAERDTPGNPQSADEASKGQGPTRGCGLRPRCLVGFLTYRTRTGLAVVGKRHRCKLIRRRQNLTSVLKTRRRHFYCIRLPGSRLGILSFLGQHRWALVGDNVVGG